MKLSGLIVSDAQAGFNASLGGKTASGRPVKSRSAQRTLEIDALAASWRDFMTADTALSEAFSLCIAS